MDRSVEVDRRMLDYIAGLDTEVQELVEGGTCYEPKVELEQVVLPMATKTLVLDTVENFARVKRLEKRVGFEEVVREGDREG